MTQGRGDGDFEAHKDKKPLRPFPNPPLIKGNSNKVAVDSHLSQDQDSSPKPNTVLKGTASRLSLVTIKQAAFGMMQAQESPLGRCRCICAGHTQYCDSHAAAGDFSQLATEKVQYSNSMKGRPDFHSSPCPKPRNGRCGHVQGGAECQRCGGQN